MNMLVAWVWRCVKHLKATGDRRPSLVRAVMITFYGVSIALPLSFFVCVFVRDFAWQQKQWMIGTAASQLKRLGSSGTVSVSSSSCFRGGFSSASTFCMWWLSFRLLPNRLPGKNQTGFQIKLDFFFLLILHITFYFYYIYQVLSHIIEA